MRKQEHYLFYTMNFTCEEDFLYGDPCYEWWKYLIMPIMAGVVGWGTNALALQMTFYPTEFVGWELFRVQDQPWGLFGFQVREDESFSRSCSCLCLCFIGPSLESNISMNLFIVCSFFPSFLLLNTLYFQIININIEFS